MIDPTAARLLARGNRRAQTRRSRLLVTATALAAVLAGPGTALAVGAPGPTSTTGGPQVRPRPIPTPGASGAPTAPALPPLPPAPPAPPPPGGALMGGPRMADRGLLIDPASGPAPDVSAPSWVVADATTGKVLAARDPHGRARPASTQKVLLALTMLPRLDPHGTYTADHDDEAVEGTRVGMVATQTYQLDDLWYAVFLRSGNDAADGIAKAGGGGDLFKAVTLMQAEARRLQAYDTTVVNPNGLDADGQYSSAYDLALFGRAALQRADLRRYAGTIFWQFPGNETKTGTPKTSKPFQIHTENRLLGRYPGAIGLKPGYTTLAQNTLIAAAERNGTTIVATLMDDSHGQITPDAEALLEWGFNHDGSAPAVGTLADPSAPAYSQSFPSSTPQTGTPPLSTPLSSTPLSSTPPSSTPPPNMSAPTTGVVNYTTTTAAHPMQIDGLHGLPLRPGLLRSHLPETVGSVVGLGLFLTVVSLRLRVRRRYRSRGAYR